jgi:hypothetical protein
MVMQEVRSRRSADPAVAEAVAHIVDATAVEPDPGLPSDHARTLAYSYTSALDPIALLPTIIVSDQGEIFGDARVFSTLAGLSDPRLRLMVVRTWEEAGLILGKDLSALEAEVRRRRAEAVKQGEGRSDERI